MSTEIAKQEGAGRFDWLQTWADDKLAGLLPEHVKPESLVRVVLGEMVKTPKLRECSPRSLQLALLDAGRLGLEIGGGPLAEAYLIPRYDKTIRGQAASLQISYRGLTKLARNSGEIKTIHADVVYRGDHFRVVMGESPAVEHEPDWSVDRSDANIVAAYAVVITKDGGVYYDVVSRTDIEAARKAGSSGQGRSTPWDNWYGRMARKTALRRLLMGGTVPLSARMSEYVRHEMELEIETARASASMGRRAIASAADFLADDTTQDDGSDADIIEPGASGGEE